ncbi:hypothetical protein [Streptomyces sp. NPDC054783]
MTEHALRLLRRRGPPSGGPRGPGGRRAMRGELRGAAGTGLDGAAAEVAKRLVEVS